MTKTGSDFSITVEEKKRKKKAKGIFTHLGQQEQKSGLHV